MRRLRATFLLRCLVLALCSAVFVCTLKLGMAAGWTAGALVFLAVFWFLAVEGGLLPLVIERFSLRRAARSQTPVSSIWFVDLDQKLGRESDKFQEDTRDNPTIR